MFTISKPPKVIVREYERLFNTSVSDLANVYNDGILLSHERNVGLVIKTMRVVDLLKLVKADKAIKRGRYRFRSNWILAKSSKYEYLVMSSSDTRWGYRVYDIRRALKCIGNEVEIYELLNKRNEACILMMIGRAGTVVIAGKENPYKPGHIMRVAYRQRSYVPSVIEVDGTEQTEKREAFTDKEIDELLEILDEWLANS